MKKKKIMNSRSAYKLATAINKRIKLELKIIAKVSNGCSKSNYRRYQTAIKNLPVIEHWFKKTFPEMSATLHTRDGHSWVDVYNKDVSFIVTYHK